MELSRIVFSKKDKTKCFITLYGYDNGSQVKQCHQFSNYIYVENDSNNKHNNHITYDNFINNKSLKRVVINDKIPKQEIKFSYQSNVLPQTKFLLDNNITFSEKRHVLFLSIQSEFNPNFPENNSVNNATAPIISIALYSNFSNRYSILTFKNDKSKTNFVLQERNDYDLYICKDEITMLKIFCKIIKQLNVDILTGWNIRKYDILYLIKRLNIVLGNANCLSPQSQVIVNYNNDSKTVIKGVDLVDFISSSQIIGYKIKNESINDFSLQFLNTKLSYVMKKDWQNNFESFLQNVLQEIQLIKKINDKTQYLNILIYLQILSSAIKLDHVLSITKIIDYILIKTFWNQYVFPDISQYEKVDISGGITIQPVPGLYNNVSVLDFASNYPTIIMSYNISPQTYLFSLNELGHDQFFKRLEILKQQKIPITDTGETDEHENDRYVFLSHNVHIGVIPRLIHYLYQIRKNFQESEQKSNNEHQKSILNKKQFIVKTLLNSIYGLLIYQKFRISKPQCGNAITLIGRKQLRFLINSFSEHGKIVYGDTDGCFIQSDIDINNIVDKFNSHVLYNDFIKKINPNVNKKYCQNELQIRQNFSKFYISDKKKRYYGIDFQGKEFISGGNFARRQTPEIAKIILSDLFNKAVKESLTYEDILLSQNIIRQQKYENIAVYKSIKKSFDNYNSIIPKHIRGIRFANRIFNINIQQNDIVYMFYIKNNFQVDIQSEKRQNVICLRKQDFHLIDETNLIQIDYDIFIQNEIILPLTQFDKINSVKKVLYQWSKNKHKIQKTNCNSKFSFGKKKF